MTFIALLAMFAMGGICAGIGTVVIDVDAQYLIESDPVPVDLLQPSGLVMVVR